MTPESSVARSICIVAAVPLSLGAFMAPHVRALRRRHRVTLIATRTSDAVDSVCGGNVTFQPVSIARSVSLAADLKALAALWRLCRRERFDLVQSITPKAGLLTMVAGRLAGVPVRVHWFTGQVWATRRGASRWLLKTLDRVLAACATHLLADSASQRAFLVQEGVAPGERIAVLEHGSVCGVDIERFRPDPASRALVRREVAIPDDAVVALYLGRLTADKGVRELGTAFARAAAARPELHLLVVGPDEGGMQSEIAERTAPVGERVHFVEHTDRPEAYMAAADIFVLPSYREGFGATVIEAAACGTPAIGSRIYGLTDAVVDGETGTLVAVGDVDALAGEIIRLAADAEVRTEMGKRARERVERQFAQERLVSALITFYERALAPLP